MVSDILSSLVLNTARLRSPLSCRTIATAGPCRKELLGGGAWRDCCAGFSSPSDEKSAAVDGQGLPGHRIGVKLFHRTPRTVVLTDDGRRFHDEVPPLLTSTGAAAE